MPISINYTKYKCLVSKNQHCSNRDFNCDFLLFWVSKVNSHCFLWYSYLCCLVLVIWWVFKYTGVQTYWKSTFISRFWSKRICVGKKDISWSPEHVMKFRVRAFILCDDSYWYDRTFDKPNVGVFYNWLGSWLEKMAFSICLMAILVRWPILQLHKDKATNCLPAATLKNKYV